MGLRDYIIKRLIYSLVLVFFVITLNFVIFELMPGFQGSFSILASQQRTTPEQYARLEELYGLNQPTHVRFILYARNMLTFQFGVSYQTGHEVWADIVGSGRLGNTLLLLGASAVLAIVIGVFLGVLVSRKRGSSFDNFWVTTSLTTYSLPTFFMGIGLILIFARGLHWFPTAGVTPFEWSLLSSPPDLLTQIVERLRHLFLPALTLTLFSYGGYLLLTRATMMETLSEDYIVTARAKGLSERTIMFKHALKNASLPIVTSVALSFGFILSGAIITETVFSWDGLGLWLFNAIGWKDFPVMQAMFYIIALSVIIANFMADIVYGLLDPRIKYE